MAKDKRGNSGTPLQDQTVPTGSILTVKNIEKILAATVGCVVAIVVVLIWLFR